MRAQLLLLVVLGLGIARPPVAAAQNPAISRSAGSLNGLTFWIGSLAKSSRL